MKALKYIDELIEQEESYLQWYDDAGESSPSNHIDRYNDLLEARRELFRLSDVVGRSEQFYCVSSNALVYGKPCEKWCGDENCKALCKQ